VCCCEQFTFGNAGRNILIGAGTNDWTSPSSAASGCPFAKGCDRAEAFNLFNRTHFEVPGTTLQTATFGVIGATNASQPNRQLQFGLKLLF